MHALGIEAFTVCHFEQGFEYVTSDLCSARRACHTKPVATTGYFDIEAALYLAQVFIELTAKVCKAAIVGGLEDNVPRNLDGIQSV